MICPKCNSQIDDDFKFCTMCGALLKGDDPDGSSAPAADDIQNEQPEHEPQSEQPDTQPQPEQPEHEPQPEQPDTQPQPEQPVYEPQPEQPVYQPQPEQPVYQPQPEQPVYQPQPEQPVYQPQPEQPVYQPQPEQPVYQPQPEQPVYQPQPEQPVYQQNVFQQNRNQAPYPNSNAQYSQQFQQFQQSNQQFKNPNYANQGYPYNQAKDLGFPQTQKKSNVLPIVIISAIALLAVAGIVFGIILVFSGGGSSEKIVAHFTEAVNKRDINLIKDDVFPEFAGILEDNFDIAALTRTIPSNVKLETKVTNKEISKKGDLKFDRYAKLIADNVDSVASEADITERNILTVVISAKGMESLGTHTFYFDTVRVKGKWYLVNMNEERIALDSFLSYAN